MVMVLVWNGTAWNGTDIPGSPPVVILCSLRSVVLGMVHLYPAFGVGGGHEASGCILG